MFKIAPVLLLLFVLLACVFAFPVSTSRGVSRPSICRAVAKPCIQPMPTPR